MAELGDVKMAENAGLAETICPSIGERAVFRRLGNTSSSRERCRRRVGLVHIVWRRSAAKQTHGYYPVSAVRRVEPAASPCAHPIHPTEPTETATDALCSLL